MGLHELVLRVDNRPLDVHLDHIFLRDGAVYFQGGGQPDGPIGSAFDFNGAGLCEIIDLAGTYDVEVHFTAHHPGDYMRFYNLVADPNSGANLTFASESYPAAAAAPPVWEGTPAGGSVATVAHGQWARCNYIFGLHAGSRLQNGYNYVQWAHPSLAFFVDP